jgi:hypothetical protein
MNPTLTFLLILLILSACAGLSAVSKADELTRYKTYLDDFMRVRGDASGKDVVFYWSGTVYSFVPGEKKQELFKFEGFNIARTIVKAEGFELLTREAAFYEDPKTGKILETWTNPFTGKDVPVVQIWNDPVNQDISFPEEYLPYVEKFLPSTDMGEYRCFNMDIFPMYTSPLPRAQYPDYSQSDMYQAGEFFQFFVEKEDLGKKKPSTIPTTISWTRISPWMPFMRMGDKPGNLIFVCRGMKLPDGYKDLPEKIKTYVENNHPEYKNPPDTWTEPNETSWTYFKKLIDSGKYPPIKK